MNKSIQNLKPRCPNESHGLIHLNKRIGKILTREKPSSNEFIATNDRSVCKVCQRNKSRYTCPRCNISYCEVKCYKLHSSSCTEAFYEGHVKENLKLQDHPSETQRKLEKRTKEILMRYKNLSAEGLLSESNDPECNASDEMFARLYESLRLNDSLDIDELSTSEQELFFRHVSEGALSSFIEKWVPWWNLSDEEYSLITREDRKGLKLVEEIDVERDTTHAIEKTECDSSNDESPEPPVVRCRKYPANIITERELESLPKLSTLLPADTEPSSKIVNNIVFVLNGYVDLLLTYNGDWSDDCPEAFNILAGNLCRVFLENETFTDLVDAVSAIRQSGQMWRIEDVRRIMGHKTMLQDAIWDCRSIALGSMKPSSTTYSKKYVKRLKAHCTKVEKKLFFYSLYVNEYYNYVASTAIKLQDFKRSQR